MKDTIYVFKLFFGFWFLFEWLLDTGNYRNTLVCVAFVGWLILIFANYVISNFVKKK